LEFAPLFLWAPCEQQFKQGELMSKTGSKKRTVEEKLSEDITDGGITLALGSGCQF
jgi:hypothetical protein